MKVSPGVVSECATPAGFVQTCAIFIPQNPFAGLSFKQHDGFLKSDPDSCQHRNTNSSPGGDQ